MLAAPYLITTAITTNKIIAFIVVVVILVLAYLYVSRRGRSA
jgi:uncharacterized membrane protein (DUF485 family)